MHPKTGAGWHVLLRILLRNAPSSKNNSPPHNNTHQIFLLSNDHKKQSTKDTKTHKNVQSKNGGWTMS